MAERRPVGRIVRAVALVLVLAAGSMSAVAACDSSTDAEGASLDPGPTFGIEVTVNVVGNGRVVSVPAGIDCPSNCFSRITSADRDFDGADIGLSLTPAAGPGSHFVGWTAQPLVPGTRARGPAECSPMTRNALGPPIGGALDELVLPYGETQGTPPKGREAECADYTTVPVAYALVARFEEDPGQPFFGNDAAPPGEVLFEPPALGFVVARELGIHDDRLYVRFDQDRTQSGIASGAKSGKGGLSIAIPPDGKLYRTVVIGPNIAIQLEDQSLTTLNLTTLQRSGQFLGTNCTALATDDVSAYCRYNSGSTLSYLFIWSLNGSGYRFLGGLPFGSALAVDDASLFFADVPSDLSFQRAAVESVLKDASDFPDSSKLVPNVTNPTHLIATASDLVWLDNDESNSPSVLGHAAKAGADAATTELLPGVGTSVAVDPTDPKTIYFAAKNGSGFAQIDRARIGGGPYETYLYGMESVNGLAVDETYVYWTQNDGRVYRAPK